MTSLTEKEPTRRGGRGARRRILAAAAQLFYFEGINATGVDFPSKTALVEEYQRQLRQRGGGEAEDAVATPKSTPRAQLLALFELTDTGGGRIRGCPFHNAAVEAAGAMPGVEHIVHLHKGDYIDGLTELTRAAGAADPEMLGNQIAMLYEGASGLSTSLNDPAPWAQARATAEALMDRA